MPEKLHTLTGNSLTSADLQSFNEELHRKVLAHPADCLPPFEEALEEMIRNQHQKVPSKLWCQRTVLPVASQAPDRKGSLRQRLQSLGH